MINLRFCMQLVFGLLKPNMTSKFLYTQFQVKQLKNEAVRQHLVCSLISDFAISNFAISNFAISDFVMAKTPSKGNLKLVSNFSGQLF